MGLFPIYVVEVHYVRCHYVVDAATPKEVVKRGEAGDMENQEWLGGYGVMDRFAVGPARPMRRPKGRS